ncbi:MAG: MBL fold metallo-hydrolase [bacterium]|nr:MBL fold metallo-hydrolase [bacterium]
MVITHHGGQCFKVTFGDLTLVFDPISKGGTLPAVKFGSDIALVSRNNPDCNGIDEVTYGDKKPFAITGPGEYERGGVTVQGFLTKGPKDTLNTIYVAGLEDMTLVHLGALASKDLPQEAREALDDIDVLFVPVGGEGVLSPSEAHELAVSLEPHIIVPMHWSGMGAPKSLEAFLKEEGGTVEKIDKLTLKKKDALTKDGAIIVLQP